MNNKEIEDKYYYQNKDYIKKLIKLRDKIRKSIINVYINETFRIISICNVIG